MILATEPNSKLATKTPLISLFALEELTQNSIMQLVAELADPLLMEVLADMRIWSLALLILPSVSMEKSQLELKEAVV